MAWMDHLKRDVREFFTSSATRSARRQSEFHLKNAARLAETAFTEEAAPWQEYYEELGRAAAADPANLRARWLRSKAADHWFRRLCDDRGGTEARGIARNWDRDLRIMLTQWPDKDPEGMELRSAREMRATFDRLCRGIKID